MTDNQKILELLMRRGSLSSAEIALALDMQHVGAKVSHMKKDGLVSYYNDGETSLWSITQKGKAALPLDGVITLPRTYRPEGVYVPPGFTNYRESQAMRCPSVGIPT